MKKTKILPQLIIVGIFSILTTQLSYAVDVPLKRDQNRAADNTNGNASRSRVYIPISSTFEYSELSLFFESNVGMCTVSVVDENDNVEFLEIIDTDNESEFWFDFSDLNSGTHYLKIIYGSMNLIGEFEVD